jgi:hypothetical protein
LPAAKTRILPKGSRFSPVIARWGGGCDFRLRHFAYPGSCILRLVGRKPAVVLFYLICLVLTPGGLSVGARHHDAAGPKTKGKPLPP